MVQEAQNTTTVVADRSAGETTTPIGKKEADSNTSGITAGIGVSTSNTVGKNSEHKTDASGNISANEGVNIAIDEINNINSKSMVEAPNNTFVNTTVA